MTTSKVENPFVRYFRNAQERRDSNARICVEEVLDGDFKLALIWAEKSKAAYAEMRELATRIDEWEQQKRDEEASRKEKLKEYRRRG